MEMEDQHPHHSHQQQQEYGLPDLRQLLTSNRPTYHFPGITQAAAAAAAAELFPGHHHRNLTPQNHYEMLMMPRGGFQDFNSNTSANDANDIKSNINYTSSVAVTTATVSTPSFSGFEGEAVASFGGDLGSGRWPRQETLTLLEIRSRLDFKFKEANQKGPLWDEVSRIMSEEHGYQRSGKKCREKFENLYKYYKKTKEGKAGRQDGKHYRFFRQLEALYGDGTSNSVSVQETHLVDNTIINHQDHQLTFPSSYKLCDSISLSNTSSEFYSSPSDDIDLSNMENESTEKRKKKPGGRSWKAKIKEFIDIQMRKLTERQEAWMEKLTKSLEDKEQERVFREEEWRRQEQARIDKEHKFWAKERAWIEARDASLMEALQNLTGKQLKVQSPDKKELIIAAAAVDHEVQNNNVNNNINKKRKENNNNSRSSCDFFQTIEGSPYTSQQGTAYETPRLQLNDSSSSGAASNSIVGNAVSDSCFRFLMADGDPLWENYGLKLSNGENQ